MSLTLEALTVTEKTDLTEHIEEIKKDLKAFYRVGSRLLDIRDRRLYRETHKTFEAFCRDVLDLTRPRAYQLMEAAGTVENLSKILDKIPTVESHVSELSKLNSPEEQQEAWNRALEIAGEKRMTANIVKEAVANIKAAPELDQSEGLVELVPREEWEEPALPVEFLKAFELSRELGEVVPEEFAEGFPDVNKACNLVADRIKNMCFDIEPLAAWLDHVEDPKAYARFMYAVQFLYRIAGNVIRAERGIISEANL